MPGHRNGAGPRPAKAVQESKLSTGRERSRNGPQHRNAPESIDVTAFAGRLLRCCASARPIVNLASPHGLRNQELGGHACICRWPSRPCGRIRPLLPHDG